MPAVPADTTPPWQEARQLLPVLPPDNAPDQLLKFSLDAYRMGNTDGALLSAYRTMEQFPNTPWYQRALFLTEQALIRLDRPAEATAVMLRVHAEYPELADYAVLILADYQFSKGSYSQAAVLYQSIADRYPASPLVIRSTFRRSQALLESYSYPEAIEALEKFLADYPRSEFAPAAGMELGRALTAEARLADAVRAYQNVWVRYPGNPNDQDIEKALAELRGGGVEIPAPSPADLLERGRNLSHANQHDKTIETFNRLLEMDPASPHRPEILFRSGVAAYNLGRRNDAVSLLEKMVKEYPNDPRTPEALHWLGRSYSKLGDWERGIKSFQKVLDHHPESEWADDALFFSGNIYREAGDMKKALHYYTQLVQEYPDSKYADSSIWWRAWSYLNNGDHKKAEQTLQELVNRYPRSFLVNQARYWQGRISEMRGDPSRAALYYERVRKKGPYTYYGYRAIERMTALGSAEAVRPADALATAIALCGESSCADDAIYPFDTDEGPPEWTEETKKLLAADPAFHRSSELMYLDMKKEAADELWSLQDKRPRKRGALIGMSKAFFDFGDYYRSIMLVLRNYERYLEGPLNGTPEDLWRLAYPQGYWESILTYSRKYNQDPFFIAAIIREESQFNSGALSPAGARGLMQVMPSTGEWVAQAIKLKKFNEGQLFDYDTGINIGTWYIGHLMKRFKGDFVLVAAAYNAGPEAVAAWVGKNGNGKDRDMFVEAIPFTETRGYVKKVMRNYAEYKRIYSKIAESAIVSPVRVEAPAIPAVTEEALKKAAGVPPAGAGGSF